MSKDEYEVSFLGNGSSSYDRVLDFALLRAAEIAFQQEARSFTVLDVVNLSSARRYSSGSHYFWTASPYLSTGSPALASASDFAGGTERTYLMVTPVEERIYYRPGVRLRITLSPEAAAGGSAYDPAKVIAEVKHKYGVR